MSYLNKMKNPYKHWWRARKIFKRPKWHLYHIGKITWFYGMPLDDRYYNKFLDIWIEPLGWKSKYFRPRHEWNPYIAITLFRKWQVVFVLGYFDKNDKYSTTRNEATWEAILDYIYFDVKEDKLVEEHTWASGVGKNTEPITIERNLKCYM